MNNNNFRGTDNAEVTKLVLAAALELGVGDAEVFLSRGHGISVRVRNQELESIEHQNDNALAVSVYMGKHKGAASTSDLRPESIRSTVAAAKDIARHSSADQCVGLADYDGDITAIPELDLYHNWGLHPKDATAIALEIEHAALNHDKRASSSEGSSVNSYNEYFSYANTAGHAHQWQTTTHSMDCEIIARDNHGMQSNGWWSVARDRADLTAAATIGRLAAERAVQKLSPQPCVNGNIMVMFEAPVATALLANLVRALQGGNLYRKSSFLLDKLGHKIFPEWVNIVERPHLPRGMASAPIDSDGTPTRNKDVIKNGFIESYLLGNYAARRLGMKSTANAGGVHNLIMQPGAQPQDLKQLLQAMGTGLLVTELMGSGTNLVTGDYSQGAAGFRIENGKILHAVEKISIAGGLAKMFDQLVAAGNDIDNRGYIHSGSLLFDGITVVGN